MALKRLKSAERCSTTLGKINRLESFKMRMCIQNFLPYPSGVINFGKNWRENNGLYLRFANRFCATG